jgi:hypothetical protein
MNEQIALSGAPTVGFNEQQATPPKTSAASPWTVAVTTSVLSAVTTWALEETARRARGRRRQ